MLALFWIVAFDDLCTKPSPLVENNGDVTFTYVGPKKDVQVAGDFAPTRQTLAASCTGAWPATQRERDREGCRRSPRAQISDRLGLVEEPCGFRAHCIPDAAALQATDRRLNQQSAPSKACFERWH
jgi:hypothetical protein